MPGKDEKRTDWNLEHGPARDPARDRTLAIFVDNNSDRRAEVSIATQTLGQIGNLPEELDARKQHTINILRAMLEEFEQHHEVKRGELIRVDEVSVDMGSLRSRFTPS